jgi:SAM-dependent methyltransferase
VAVVTPDAITGWDEDANAEAYAAFARAFPMYSATSRDLVARAHLTDSRLVVDLCGGTGVTAQAILDLAPDRARVISLDNAAAMQRVGRRHVHDPRLSWVTAPAENLAGHAPTHQVDAVVCNSAIWKTDMPTVAAAVRRVLRPGGRFVFNIGASFAGLPGSDTKTGSGPSLDSLIRHIAARDYGYTPPAASADGPKLHLATVTRHLADAGLTVVNSEVTVQYTTMAERKAWLSIPIFARPNGDFSYAQKMQILGEAYAQTRPDETTVTSWLVVVAQPDGEQP